MTLVEPGTPPDAATAAEVEQTEGGFSFRFGPRRYLYDRWRDCQGMHTHSLLAQPLLTVRAGAGERLRTTLPDLLAHLGRGEELEPLALRPHQHHAWHAFLVQLGALVLHRTGDRSLGFPVPAGIDPCRRRSTSP